jgi:hypothetical protein
VVRGAVAKALQGDVNIIATRKNRRHYGTSCNHVFDASIHKESDAYVDEYDGVKRAENQMDWLLKQGKDLPTPGAAHAKIDMNTNFWLGEKRQCWLELRACNKSKAPRRSCDNVGASIYRSSVFY